MATADQGTVTVPSETGPQVGGNDALYGGAGGANYIQPNDNDHGGLACIQVKNDANGLACDSTAPGDSVAWDPGYGGGADWTFNDFDSGVRLGEGTVTPVAVYATWNNSVSLDGGTQWAQHAQFDVYDGTTLLGSLTNVNQQSQPGDASPEPNDRPWTLLGVWNVAVGDTLTVRLSDPTPHADGDRLCVGDAMIHPLWPAVFLHPADITVNSQVSAITDTNSKDPETPSQEYCDWYGSWNAEDLPVEGDGDRAHLEAVAAIDPLFAQAPAWTGAYPGSWTWNAQMPAILDANSQPEVYFWNDATSNTPWQSQSIDTTYTSDVWVSANPSATLPDSLSITFKACAPPGGGDAQVNAGLKGTPVTIPGLPQVPPQVQDGYASVYVCGYPVAKSSGQDAGGVGYHTFLLVPYEGKYYGFRGGPTTNNSHGEGYGPLIVSMGTLGAANFPDSPQYLAHDKPAAKELNNGPFKFNGGTPGLIAVLTKEGNAINAAKIPYLAVPPGTAAKGANCNCVTTWLLNKTGQQFTILAVPNWVSSIPGGIPAGWGLPAPKGL
jgi:hypothetical protein